MLTGKEALMALANGEEVEVRHPHDKWYENWESLNLSGGKFFLSYLLDEGSNYQFRLKPRTITINGIEVPAPFEPPENLDNSLLWWALDTDQECGYSQCRNPEHPSNLLGAWSSEDEIKQVVAALRSIFK